MTGSSRRRAGRGRLAVAGALAALGVMAFGVSSAHAASENVSFSFDDAILSLPDPAGNSDILDAPPPATMDGTADTTTHALFVDSPDFFFPGFDGSLSGIPLHVEFSAIDDITGTADTTTGAVSTNPSTFETVVALGAPINSSCTYNSDESFKTGSGTSFNGDPFTVAAGDPRAFSDGILQTSWGASHFALVDNTGDCSLVTNIINSGCGGLAIANGLTPAPLSCAPPAGGSTPPPATAPPKKKKCKKAKKKSASASKKSKCKKKKK
jgi:hypothetical protein